MGKKTAKVNSKFGSELRTRAREKEPVKSGVSILLPYITEI